MRFFNFLIFLCFSLYSILSCVKEKSDIPQHITKTMGSNTMRIDKYNETLIVYLLDDYDSNRILLDLYSELLIEAKNNWNIGTIQIDFTNDRLEKNDTVLINDLLKRTNNILKEKYYYSEKDENGYELKPKIK